jgi:hypothetical protein
MATGSDPSRHVPEWRNWQTRGTQNPEPRKGRVGSTPTSGTSPINNLGRSDEFPRRCRDGPIVPQLSLTNDSPVEGRDFGEALRDIAFSDDGVTLVDRLGLVPGDRQLPPAKPVA